MVSRATRRTADDIRWRELGRRRPFSHRSDLDGRRARQWTARGEGDRLVQILDVDEHVTAKMLTRLGERTVGQETLAVPHPDGRRRRRRVERVTAQVLPARCELVRELHLLPVELLPLGQAPLVPRLVEINQQQVFHGAHPPRYVERQVPGSTPGVNYPSWRTPWTPAPPLTQCTAPIGGGSSPP